MQIFMNNKNNIYEYNKSQINIPVHCINLARAKERKDYITEEWINKRGVPVSFFEGIDCEDIDESNYNNLPEPFRQNIINISNNGYPFKSVFSHKLGIGEVCCSVSHCLLLKQLIDLGIDEAIIIEDDAEPLFENATELYKKINKLKINMDNVNIMLLHKLEGKFSNYDFSINEDRESFYISNDLLSCTQCIYYTRQGMIDCYNHASKLIVPMDFTWIFGFIEKKQIGLTKDPISEHNIMTTYVDSSNSHRLYLSKNKDSKIDPQIDAFIFNWRGQLEKTLKTESELCKIFNKVTVINSDDNNKFDHWINIGEDAYFGAQFLKALELFSGDIFFHVQADVTYDNWPSIIESAKLYYKKYNYGIYAPNVDYTYWDSAKVDIDCFKKTDNEKLKIVSMTDCSCWFINKKIINEYKLKYSHNFKKNKYGFGADLISCAISFKKNMPVLRDYQYTVSHPKLTNYSLTHAGIMLEDYIKTIDDKDLKFLINNIRNCNINNIKNYNKQKFL